MAGEVKRMNYYNGLFLKEEDFKCDQNYHIRMLRLHNRLMHNAYGVVEGLEVVPSGTKNFLVKKGAAIAQVTTESGEEHGVCILLAADQEVEDLKDKTDGVWYLTISYDDGTLGDIEKNKGDKEIHIIERPKIKCDASAPSDQNKKDILLAKIILTGLGAGWTSSAGMIKTDGKIAIQKGVGSIDGISNPGGNVDFLTSGSISITSDPTKKSITIGENHSGKTDNPHGTTADQIKALPLAGGTINGNLTVQGNTVLGNEDADSLTIKGSLASTHSSGRLAINSPVAVAGSLTINNTVASEVYFLDSGQIRSFDDKHRILFRRPENKLEIREFGDIVFSPGATAGTETAKTVMLSNGNVGIGTTDPKASLHVAQNMAVGPFSVAGAEGNLFTTGANSGLNIVKRSLTAWPATPAAGDRFVWCNRDGAARLWTDQQGDLLTVTGKGNVVIGTPGPEEKFLFEVAGRMKVRGDKTTGTAGIWFSQQYGFEERGFIGLSDDNHIGFWGNTGAQWGLVMDTGNGNVGIGKPSAAEKLEVNGSVKATSFIGDGSKLTGIKGVTGAGAKAVSVNVTNINVRTSAVDVGAVTITAPSAGYVVVRFDGMCWGTSGDRLVLAASNASKSWGVNDGSVSILFSSTSGVEGTFSHTRVYAVAAGPSAYFAVAQNYVSTAGSGTASIYGTLTVEFFPNGL